ncbi:hypothetical protein [Companilactobacillus baiquanensis]|uniref:Uncharacterized protein n=1 Tax=Companilactobacillus baiquanensis TaxID=2486005 RepID=A0ABW1USI4_9LACO|nr:hypothetical protein [Companilactobacillus baiquanensis]
MDQILVILTFVWMLVTAIFLGLSLIRSLLELKYVRAAKKDDRLEMDEDLQEKFVNVHQFAGILVSILIMIVFSVQIGQTFNASVDQSLKNLLSASYIQKTTWLIVFIFYNLYAIVGSYYLVFQNRYIRKIFKKQ